QHQLKPSIPCALCQYKSTIILRCNKEATHGPRQGSHQEVRKPQTLRHFWEPLPQSGGHRRLGPKWDRRAGGGGKNRGGHHPWLADPAYRGRREGAANRTAAGASAATHRRVGPRRPRVHHVVSEIRVRCLPKSAEHVGKPFDRGAIRGAVSPANDEEVHPWIGDGNGKRARYRIARAPKTA